MYGNRQIYYINCPLHNLGYNATFDSESGYFCECIGKMIFLKEESYKVPRYEYIDYFFDSYRIDLHIVNNTSVIRSDNFDTIQFDHCDVEEIINCLIFI